MSYREATKEKILSDINVVLGEIDSAETNRQISYISWLLMDEALTQLQATIENSPQDIITTS